MNKVYLTIPGRDKLAGDYYRKSYGEFAVITRLGRVNMIHLDLPSSAVIQRRIEETILEQSARSCECPICRKYKDHPLDIVFFDEDNGWAGF